MVVPRSAASGYRGILSGDAVAALAIDEGPHHRPARTALRAERSGNGFRLTGTKSFVQHGHVADLLIVAARSAGEPGEEEGVTLFAVERGADGLNATPERLADASLASRLAFDGVEVDADAVIGEVGDRLGAARRACSMRCAPGRRPNCSASARGRWTCTIGYLKERKQFGVAIGSFQALQHRAAHLYSELEVARAATLKAQQLLDANDDGAERAVIGRQGDGRARDGAGGAGRRADARRHRHDRRI